ncbi:MAG: HupE/UreJ family protein [Waterburya sp.]
MNKNQAIAFGGVFGVLFAINFFTNTSPALAHHPMGGKLPSNFIEGLLSGLGHPVIGIDHLAFVIAIGLLAALSNRLGMVIPLAFMLTTAVGTLIHLQSIDLPVVELVISVSVLLMGILLAQTKQTNLALLTIISAIAGIFHGYAYGESIVGAETLAIGAYLLGFCLIQLAISAIAFYLGKTILKKPTLTSHFSLHFVGLIISGIGFAFLSSAILG